jgi:CheY-like chemotaxis protein
VELYDLTQSVKLFLRRPLVLSSHGYEVAEGANEEEAIGRCQELPRLDLLICDIGIGPSSGTEAALRVRSVHNDVPVLFVSGTPTNAWDQGDVNNILKLPLDSVDFLEKPFRPAALLERAEQLLAKRAQRPRGKTAGDGR